jgi:hypothetical protein
MSRPLVILLSVAASSCLTNPAFDPDAGSVTSTDAGSATATSTGTDATGAVTTGNGDDSSTAADGSTLAADASTSATSGGPSSSDGTSDDGSSSGDSSGGSPATHDVLATIGTCVFPAIDLVPDHGGPDECSADADKINNTVLEGLMMVDVHVNNLSGKTRPAVPYLRFDFPEALIGLTLVSATLHVQVADGVTDLPQSGELWLSAGFTEQTLESTAPELIERIADDMGEVQPDDWLTWPIDPALIGLSKPLHLALKPTHDKGVILRGATTADSAPYLTIEVE